MWSSTSSLRVEKVETYSQNCCNYSNENGRQHHRFQYPLCLSFTCLWALVRPSNFMQSRSWLLLGVEVLYNLITSHRVIIIERRLEHKQLQKHQRWWWSGWESAYPDHCFSTLAWQRHAPCTPVRLQLHLITI